MDVLSVICLASIITAAFSKECSHPNKTDINYHWWSCGKGTIEIHDVLVVNSEGKEEYPFDLTKPIYVISNVTNFGPVYTDMTLSMYLWYLSPSKGCKYRRIPTLGMMEDLDACQNGVTCPVPHGPQRIKLKLDFTPFRIILSKLKRNAVFKMRYKVTDRISGATFCFVVETQVAKHPQ
ncbi:hypothetical protein AB6A40_002564 [Gnathostoma spinigerum]|uniref:MD-2-related lipid-recognition domain-containing protein n=1 Tax=Gnathostoma spinigerum TaxID=75299 RepID=A0ABD6EHR0_9BILA